MFSLPDALVYEPWKYYRRTCGTGTGSGCSLAQRHHPGPLWTENKYDSSHEQVANALLKYSANHGLNVLNYYELVLQLSDRQHQHAPAPPYWARCQQCDDLLYQYVPYTTRSAKPLRITDFDNQFCTDYSRKVFPG